MDMDLSAIRDTTYAILLCMSGLVSELLARRGITDIEDVERFLNPNYERDTHSPFLLENMERAVSRLLLAMQQKERIAVYADFDCDGIPGAALLSDFFEKIGYDNVEVYLPHRDREGYGFHSDAIATLAARGVSLIITVDVGTTAVDAVTFAKEKGIDVIVTDHHEIVNALPECIVLNPKLGSYPFRELCGAATAFKLVHATLIEGRKRGLTAFTNIPEGWEKWLLDFVAIATIADMVPLTGENRALAHFGLRVLRKTPRLGLLALFNRLRLRRAELSEDDIGFSIAPRINAASRMDEPQLALQLLVTRDHAEAEHLAAHLEELNAKRKGVVAGIVKQAKKTVRERFRSDERVVVLGNPEWKPALLGLAANSLMEERGGVVCLWGRDANGNLKGSCRSDGSLSIVELFSSTRDSFVEFGGHHASGGFTVSSEQVHTLPEDLQRAAEALTVVPPSDEAGAHDALLSIPEIGPSLFQEVSRIAPFGVGNPKPIFLLSSLTVSTVRSFGREQNHVEVVVSCTRTGKLMRGFDFFRKPDDFTHVPSTGTEARLLATVEKDSFRGGLALRLLDVLAR